MCEVLVIYQGQLAVRNRAKVHKSCTLLSGNYSKTGVREVLVHSLLMFALQLCLTFQCFVASTDWFGFQRLIYENRQPAALVVPRWLQLWSNDWLAGDTYCVVYLADVSPEEGINFCGILYAVLTGYLPVGPDQHLEALIEYVFALSGAPLLLIVRYVYNRSRLLLVVKIGARTPLSGRTVSYETARNPFRTP